MANANTPFGLAPVRYLNGAPWNGQGRTYYIPSTDTNAYAIGDPVVLAGSGDANGIASVTILTPGSGILGAILGFGGSVYGGPGAIPGSLESTIIPATKTIGYYVFVCDDPWVIFEVQEVSGGTQLAATDIGLNTNLSSGTNSGYLSGWQLANASKATTSSLDVKLLGLSQRKQTTPNAFGAYAKWEVLLNNHMFKAGTTGK